MRANAATGVEFHADRAVHTRSMIDLRRWNRAIHRDLGFFFTGATMLYAISGLALNHRSEWNPWYRDERIEFTTHLELSNSGDTEAKARRLLDEVYSSDGYERHAYIGDHQLTVYAGEGTRAVVHLRDGTGFIQIHEKRPFFNAATTLHRNPKRWWTRFSDVYAVALLIICLSGLFNVRGRQGVIGVGGLFLLAGFAVPIAFLWFG